MTQESFACHDDQKFSAHWLTKILHETSQLGLSAAPEGEWSSPSTESMELLRRFSLILSTHENSPPAVLNWLSSFNEPWLLERLAENPNTPAETLEKLIRSDCAQVRAAVADNPKAPFEILFALSRDEQADVRYRLAENYLAPSKILEILADDENPFVAHRAQETIRRTAQHTTFVVDVLRHKLTVLVVDDDDVTRLVLSLALKSDPLIQIVAQTGSAQQAINLALEHQPEIILMDIGMPGMNGIEATREIKQLLPQSKIIMVTAHDSIEEIISAFGNGAEGYHLKSTPNHDLSKAIRIVASGSYWLDPGIASLVLRELSNKSLTILQRLAASRETTRLPNPCENLISITDVYLQANKLSEARTICQAAFSLAQSMYGDEATCTNKAMGKLAELYFLQEEYCHSESTYLNLVKMQSKLCKLEDPELEKYLSLLAEFYSFRWNYEQAEIFYSWLLRIREKNGDVQGQAEIRQKLTDLLEKSDLLPKMERQKI